MRESIGAGWLTSIVIAFIVLFSAFLAFSVNRTKAYRVKDEVISAIEKERGFNETAKNNVDEILNNIGYVNSGNCYKIAASQNGEGTVNPIYGVNMGEGIKQVEIAQEKKQYNYCIEKVTTNDGNASKPNWGSYYKVYVFYSIKFPVMDISNFFVIKGETSFMYFAKDDLPTGA